MLLLLLACAQQFKYEIDACELWDLDRDGYSAAWRLAETFESQPSGEDVERLLEPCTEAEAAELLGEVAADCDDRDASVNPGAAEACDGLDNNCDGVLDRDADGDGHYGVGTCADDCDDTNPEVSPGAAERCNLYDDDCDGLVDEDFDADGDGWATCAGDCDDALAAVFPGAVEACDGRDSDCDGLLDDDETDDDGDGWSECDGDCDDGAPDVYPGAVERCDGLDSDCSGDGLDLSELDEDGDGARACDDCDDLDPSRAPGLPEWCDAVDNNCDDRVDEGFDADGDGWTTCAGDCDDTSGVVYPGADEGCDGLDTDCNGLRGPEELDFDGDGWSVCDGDCDDARVEAWPGAGELCNGLDDDCDGVAPADEDDADLDGASACEGDCDDTNPRLNLFDLDRDGASACEGDCDDLDAALNQLDADGDGATSCDGDCDDLDGDISPGEPERCNEADEDCDGRIDEDFADLNTDGIADCIELCDGMDNDADGSVDEGFSDGDVSGTWVSASSGSPDGDGTWLRPLDTIGGAVARSLTDGACTIRVQPGTYTDPIELPARALHVLGQEGPELTILQGSSDGPILSFEPGAPAELIVEGFTFRDGALRDESGLGFDELRQGAAVQIVDASPTLRCDRFEDNRAVDRGGAVHVEGGTATIEDSLFAGNTADGIAGDDGGGAIFVASGELTVRGSTFYANGSAGDGGAIRVEPGARLTLESSRFYANVSDALGGAITLNEAEASISGVLVQGNSAAAGGGLYVDVGDGDLSLTHLTFLENEGTTGYAGGVAFQDDGGEITASIFGWPVAGGLVGWVTDDVSVPPSASVTWSLVWDPSGSGYMDSNFSGALDLAGAEGQVNADPRFSAFDADLVLFDDTLTLSAASPARDAAGSGAADADGSAPDMGGLGGPTPYEPVPTCFGGVP